MSNAPISEQRQAAIGQALGDAIASRREKVGLTQEQVAEMLGIGNQAISRMERGAVIPSVVRLFEFAEAFNCRVEDLLRESSDRADDNGALLSNAMHGLPIDDQRALVASFKMIADRMRISTQERARRR